MKEGPKGGGVTLGNILSTTNFSKAKGSKEMTSIIVRSWYWLRKWQVANGGIAHSWFFLVLLSSLVFVAIGNFGTIACKTGSAKLSKDSSISFGCCCRDVYETLTGQISLDVAPFSSRIDDCHVSWPLGRIWCPSASSLLCTSSRSLCFLAYQVCSSFALRSSLFYRDCDFALFFVPLLLENRLFA
jgi:hypothetical protein